MLRSVSRTSVGLPILIAGLFLLPSPACAALWPDQLGQFKKVSSQALVVKDNRALWDEYGLDAAEQAEYTSAAGQSWRVVSYRLKDPTSALAAFQWRRPADAKPSGAATIAAETSGGEWMVLGNYLYEFSGWKPTETDLEPVIAHAPRLDTSPLPTLKEKLPAGLLVPNSERYILGPVSLAAFDPGIPPSVAAFHMGAEAQVGRFKSKGGPMLMAVFSYPTPQIARLQHAEFSKLPDAMARRAGPLVSVILSPPDRDDAERLLAEVKYNATVTLTERVPTAKDNYVELILNIFVLIGILLALFLVAGLIFGFLRRWLRWGSPDEPIILLHLEDR